MVGVVAALAGASSIYTGAATVTVGSDITPTADFYGKVGTGTISPTTWAGTGFNIPLFFWRSASSGAITGTVVFYVDSTTVPNAGWEVLNIAGNTFLRSAANYTVTSTQTVWSWSTVTNPFGTTVGATRSVRWS